MSTRMEMLQRYSQIARESVKVEIPVKSGLEIHREKVKQERDQAIQAQRDAVSADLEFLALVADNKHLLQPYNIKVESCKKRGLEWRITFAQFVELMKAERCAYTGVKFPKNSGRTIERVNPLEGYTPENVVVVTNAANSEKSRLDAFVHSDVIPTDMKVKLMRKALYQLEKKSK